LSKKSPNDNDGIEIPKGKRKKYFDEVSQFLREKIKNTKHNKLTSFCFFEGRIVLYNQGSKIWWPDR